MVGQFAREYEGKVQFLTFPGQDSEKPMQEFVKEFRWPESMLHGVDQKGELWQQFEVRFRGTWILLNDDGQVLHRTVGHVSEKQVRSNLERLVSS